VAPPGAGRPAGWPQDLFGSLPEPPTDAPPPPVLDPANPDHGKLQQPQESFSALPGDARAASPTGYAALREGLIQPRASVRGGPEAMQLLELDILMKNTAQMPYVKFPHAAHTPWLACTNCHDGLFVPKAGANPTTMPKILAGESCGVLPLEGGLHRDVHLRTLPQRAAAGAAAVLVKAVRL
jgi:c(7)-type cytochrome triheme protein